MPRALTERPTHCELLSDLATERLALILRRADLHDQLTRAQELRHDASALRAEARLAQRTAERHLRTAQILAPSRASGG